MATDSTVSGSHIATVRFPQIGTADVRRAEALDLADPADG
jgi:hypothetical protein